MALISISAMSERIYELYDNQEWIWPLFFSLSFVLAFGVHCFLKFFNVHNYIISGIILLYCAFIFLFVNGVAGETEKEVSVIVFLLLIPIYGTGLVLSLCPRFGIDTWEPFAIMGVIYIPCIVGAVLIEPDLWPLVLIETFFSIIGSIWAILEAIFYYDDNLIHHKHQESDSFMQLAISLITCPIVFPLAFILWAVSFFTKSKKLLRVA
jgi:hypothetical protein